MQRSDSSSQVDRLLERVVRDAPYTSADDLRKYLSFLFADTILAEARMLDIGGGSGEYCLYASAMGAQQAICLEPGADGSTSGVRDRFDRWAADLGIEKVEMRDETLEQFAAGQRQFDIVLLNNSINHIDEEACIHLRKDARARDTYLKIFSQIAGLCAPGARLILADCSSRNFFQLIRCRNPLAPTIEWHKHQPPWVWADLAKESGFRNCVIQWTPFSGRPVGAIGAFLLTSHFRVAADWPSKSTS